MANTFTKNPDGSFSRLPSGRTITLTQGDPFMGGITQFDHATGRRLAIGEQTTIAAPDNQGAPAGGAPMQPTPEATGSNPADVFNNILFSVLQKSQGVNTVELLKRRRELQRASLDRTSKKTDSDLRTLSPAQQDAIRSGDVNALEGEIDDNEYEIKKAETAISNFERMYEEGKKFGEKFAENMVAPDSVIQSYVRAISARPSAMGTILAGVNDKTRQKVIESLDYTKLGTESGGKDTTVDVPTWEEYLKAAEEIAMMTLKPEARAELKTQYDAEYGQYSGGFRPQKFTSAELKKLEQGGLLNAPRKEQLDYLYKSKSGDDLVNPFE